MPERYLSGPPGSDVPQYDSRAVPAGPEGGEDEITVTSRIIGAEHLTDIGLDGLPIDNEPAEIVDVEEDPRGENACTECDEGEMVPTGRRHPAATQAICNVCGHAE